MKLIDKDKLLKELRKYHPISYGIFSDIEYFPTAYDVDKVIEQLEETFDKWGLDDDKKSIMREMIKKGGAK